ncbi:uncharacterized protein LOC127878930 [Dreissena polymorpha]|uniref:MYND-type domain-containing protein n=1 Tax=Dreissena polymorpha TaxID=45954 RepID=A0A9D4QL85_DREPO|nr:uncharacterized protein LOC127878930 [Dreissena polymorpha]KAH3835139.1 hypothetical protein DPMN_108482 [Dreissena polymorpha]
MSNGIEGPTFCHVCKTQLNVMKRCSRCRNVLYCSRECQTKDWSVHKTVCYPISVAQQIPVEKRTQPDKSIFDDLENSSTASYHHPPLVNFSLAVKNKNNNPVTTNPGGKCYLHDNEYHTDVPVVSEEEPFALITVKYNKDKRSLNVQLSWTGEALYKYFAHSLHIPLENLKIIHKGKIMSRENIIETVKNKAVYQVFGEAAENEDDVDQRDIAVMMEQTGMDRNRVVRVLKKKGDLIDALLDQ